MSDHARIAKLNDQFRQTFQGEQVVITQGIFHLPEGIQAQIIQKVQDYSRFTLNNDPNSEHDFGNFQIGTKTIFWKIDYFDLTMESHSPDPANPDVTVRVLTIMLADEY